MPWVSTVSPSIPREDPWIHTALKTLLQPYQGWNHVPFVEETGQDRQGHKVHRLRGDGGTYDIGFQSLSGAMEPDMTCSMSAMTTAHTWTPGSAIQCNTTRRRYHNLSCRRRDPGKLVWEKTLQRLWVRIISPMLPGLAFALDGPDEKSQKGTWV